MTLFLFLIATQLNGIVLDRADESGCDISYTPQARVVETDSFVRFILADGQSSGSPGEPDLAFREFWIGVPQTGDIRLEVDAPEEIRTTGRSVLPVPRRSFERPDLFVPNPSIYSRNEVYPPTVATVREIGTLRGLRVARIRINPARYNPVDKTLRVCTGVRLRVRFTEPGRSQPAVARRGGPDHGQTILNYPVCRDWRSQRVSSLPNPFAVSANWLKIRIRDEGVYKISYSALQARGIDPAAVDPRTLRLFNIGDYTINSAYPESALTEIPVWVSGETDGRFDKPDYLLFYARSTSYRDDARMTFVSNPFTDDNCFWLAWGGSAGKRMAVENGGTDRANPRALNRLQATTHLERDSLNTAWCGLLWNWVGLDGQLNTHAELPVVFPNGDSLLRLDCVFYPRSIANRLRISFNQQPLTTVTFASTVNDPYDPDPYPFTIPVEQRLTREDNTLAFAIEGSDTSTTFLDYIDAVYVQRFSLKNQDLRFYLPPDSAGYAVAVATDRTPPLIFDISEPFAPRLVTPASLGNDSLRFNSTGGLFLVTDQGKLREPDSLERRAPGALRSQPRADYYIVVPDEFYDAALFLERHRQGTAGLVRTAKLSSIYDDYGYGIEEPGALKEFFKDKQPSSALLAADGSYDYKNHLARTVPPMIPPYEKGRGLEPSVYGGSVAGIDSWFADFDGSGTTPDMALARITARSPTELKQYIDKVVAYETNSRGPWQRRFIVAADDVKGSSTGETDHTEYSESMASRVGGICNPVKVYLTEYPYEGSAKPSAQTELVRQLNLGGIGFTFYGHGNGHQLAHERVFDITDVPRIQNGRRLPFGFFGSCGVGRFEDTNFECIAEELVRSRFGAIGSYAATKATFGIENRLSGAALFTALLAGKTFGEAGEEAMLAGSNETYVLFGDPMLKLLLPETTGTIVLDPATLPLGGPVRVTAVSPTGPGGTAEYSVAGYGPSFRRTFIWTDQYGRRDSLIYGLPGQQFFRGVGMKNSDTVDCRLIVPLDLPRSSVMAADGYYLTQPNSGIIDVLSWTADRAVITRRKLVGIDTTYTPSPDGAGPQVTLFADGRRITDNAVLPRNFVLSGELSDPSGIRLISVAGKDPFGFYINKPPWFDLADIFTYDPGSFTRGRFRHPVSLPTTTDTVIFNAYDNLSNRTVVRTVVTTSATEQLAIQKPLVYPNPAKADAWFTFTLTKAAFVDLKLYTITGRRVRTITDFPGRAGYNQIHWEGRDDGGAPLANGVYFYTLAVHTETAGASEESATIVDRFMVVR